MIKELNIPKLRLKLIELYEMYLENPDNQLLKETFQLINSEFRDADDIMSKPMAQAVNSALYLGLDLDNSPSIKEIKKLIVDLKAECENE